MCAKFLPYFQALFLIASLLFATSSSLAQSPLAVADAPIVEVNEDFLIPSQVDENKYYVDLESLQGQLSDLSVIDESEKVVINESLEGTPSDALYELDLSNMNKGRYKIRVRSFKEEKTKDIIIK